MGNESTPVSYNNTLPDAGLKRGFASSSRTAVVGFFQSIRFRAWLGVCVLAIAPVLALGLFSLNVIGGIARDILIEGNIQAFQQVKYEVDQYVSAYDELTAYLAADSRLADHEAQACSEALQQLDKSYEYIQRIVLVSPDKALLAHSKPDQSVITELTVPEKLLLDSPQKIMFSPEAFHVKSFLNDSVDSPALVSTVSFLKLRKSLEGITFGTNFRYFLVTQNGENILEQPNFPKELIADLMEKPCGAYDVFPVSASIPPQVAISLPILNYNLRIFVFQEAGEVYAVARSIGRKTFNFILLLCFVAVFLAAWFSNRITGPVIAIADKANELSEGNLDVTVDYQRPDEIGFLAGCFNNMSRRIRKKVFELSALYRVTQFINTSATYQQALDNCLEHLIEIFQAKRGSIMLLNEERSHLRVESFRQAGSSETAAGDEKRTGRFELKIGEGIAGEVALSGEAILCMDCRSDERFKDYDSSNGVKAPETLISAPLSIHGNVIGVINLSDRSNSKMFSDEDLELLLAIAKQMAMSIDNARLHELSISDTLTELYIKKFFQIRLEDEIKRARRFSFPLTLVMFDVDGLEAVNEAHGRKAGDTVLFEIARILKESVRATDIPARYGPEEFAAILAHTTAEQALIFAERLRERIAAHKVEFGGNAISVTVSVGICQFETGIERHYQFVERTEAAVNESKRLGRNLTTTFQKKEQAS